MYKSELKLHKKHTHNVKCFGTMFYEKRHFRVLVHLGSYTTVSAKLSAYYVHCIDAIKADKFMGDYQDYYESMAYDLEYVGDYEDYYESLENDLQYGDGDY